MTALVEDHGKVRLITFHRPEKKNAFDMALYEATAHALHAALEDDAVHAVVMTGAGDAFSAGQDLQEMAAMSAGGGAIGKRSEFPTFLGVLQSFHKPLLAAVNGVAVGIGMTMLSFCDLVYVGESARAKVPFVPLGVAPEAASSVLFPLRMGWQRAARVLMLGEWVSPAQLVELGLALEVRPDATLLADTLELAGRIAEGSLTSLVATKRLMLAADADLIRDARLREDVAFARLLDMQLPPGHPMAGFET
ncbi:MAG TPA: enoyl-CoA hydratase-related protein [Mycobacteriales bacterium]|nr:enoyl-CoA hydratase-related protein [Mycobacteriales bacterium]